MTIVGRDARAREPGPTLLSHSLRFMRLHLHQKLLGPDVQDRMRRERPVSGDILDTDASQGSTPRPMIGIAYVPSRLAQVNTSSSATPTRPPNPRTAHSPTRRALQPSRACRVAAFHAARGRRELVRARKDLPRRSCGHPRVLPKNLYPGIARL